MTFEFRWHLDPVGALRATDVDDLNHRLRRRLHTKHGAYRRPLELVLERLAQNT